MCIPRFRSTEVFFINNVPPARGVPGIFIQKLAFLESTECIHGSDIYCFWRMTSQSQQDCAVSLMSPASEG